MKTDYERIVPLAATLQRLADEGNRDEFMGVLKKMNATIEGMCKKLNVVHILPPPTVSEQELLDELQP